MSTAIPHEEKDLYEALKESEAELHRLRASHASLVAACKAAEELDGLCLGIYCCSQPQGEPNLKAMARRDAIKAQLRTALANIEE